MIEKRHFSTRHTDNSDEVSDEESQASDKFHCTSATTDKKKVRLYNGSYLSMGFTWTGDSSCPKEAKAKISLMSCLHIWTQKSVLEEPCRHLY
jgi:hypothetical protein